MIFITARVMNGGAAPNTELGYPPGSQSVFDAAKGLYGDSGVILSATNPYFSAAFPHHELFAVYSEAYRPPYTHFMAWQPQLSKAYDITENFTALVNESGVLLASSAQVLNVSRAYAELAISELQPDRAVVYASDSTLLSYSVTDPIVTQFLNGWKVELSTWAGENGVLMNWTLHYSLLNLLTTHVNISAAGIGPGSPEFAAFELRPGIRLYGNYSDAQFALEGMRVTPDGNIPLQMPKRWPTGPKDNPIDLPCKEVTSRTAFDSAVWHVCWLTNDPLPLDSSRTGIAHRLADLANQSYETQVWRNPICGTTENPNPNWGFESRDEDCWLEVRIADGEGTITRGAFIPSSSNATIFFGSTYPEFFRVVGLAYLNPTRHNDTTIARTMMTHEFIHHLQESVVEQTPLNKTIRGWRSLYEGQARFVQTIGDPSTEDDVSSLWAHDARKYNLQPYRGLCNQANIQGSGGYPTALFWSYVYKTTGGISTIGKALNATLNVTGDLSSASCHAAMPGVINSALGGSNASTDRLASVWADFGVALQKQNFTWSPPHSSATTNWSAYAGTPIHDVGRNPQSLDAWALSYQDIPITATTANCSLDPDLVARFVMHTANGWQASNASCPSSTVPWSGANAGRFLVHSRNQAGNYTIGWS